jgi:hypothetical protein
MNDAVSSFTKSVLVNIVLNSTHVSKQFDREFLQGSSAFALYYPDVEHSNRYLSAVLMLSDIVAYTQVPGLDLHDLHELKSRALDLIHELLQAFRSLGVNSLEIKHNEV